MRLSRVAFISCHGYLDPSSGAARATRELLELLAARGADGRALATGVLDFRAETPLERVLGTAGVPVRRGRAVLCGGGSVPAFDLVLGGARVTLLATASSRIERSPTGASRRRCSTWPSRSSSASGRRCCSPTAATPPIAS